MSNFRLRDLNAMEREFMTALKGRLFVREEEYMRWVTAVQALGQEHALVLKAARMSREELKGIKLGHRPDLMAEVFAARRVLSRSVSEGSGGLI
jgi:hypothetical protein